MSTTNNAPATITVAIAAVTDMLVIGNAVLTHIGRPAHHTELYTVAKELGFNCDKIQNLNPRIWADWRAGEKSTGLFRFYGKSVFGLSAWGDEFQQGEVNPSDYAPARKAKAIDPTKIDSKLEALKAQIAELEALRLAHDATLVQETETETEVQ